MDESDAVQEVLSCDFRCIALGFTAGKQTIERGELTAVIKACQHALLDPTCHEIIIVTDSLYVIDVYNIVCVEGWEYLAYRSSNFDLLLILGGISQKLCINFIKVKSHRKFCEAKTLDELRLIMGNDIADKSAAAAMRRLPDEI